MEKSRDIGKYINTIRNNTDFFSQYYFHSLIDLNLIKLDSILKNGILSKKLIEANKLVNLYTHDGLDFDSKNGYEYISLSEYLPSCEFSQMFESFALHTMTSLSIMVDKSIHIQKEGERMTYFDDEIFFKDKIEKDFLVGIILPDNLSNMTIDKVNCLPSDYSCYTKKYLNNWCRCIEEYFQLKITTEQLKKIKLSQQQLMDIAEEYEDPTRWIHSALRTQQNQYKEDLKDVLASVLREFWAKKLNIENSTYLEAIIKINKGTLPIYEIKEKSLKKINHL